MTPGRRNHGIAVCITVSRIAQRGMIPDVGIVKASTAPMPMVGSKNGATATMSAVSMRIPEPYPMAHYRILIRDMRRRKLVTVLEFLSPVNKRGDGRRQYLRKRNRILRSGTHLMEIDLLRQGLRVPMDPAGDYFVVLSRADKRPDAEVWGVALEQHLPVVPVPLLHKDADVLLDLQKAVTDVYDLGRFRYVIDYRKPPDVRLTREENAWAIRLLKSKGLR
jgi:hypothetical protein